MLSIVIIQLEYYDRIDILIYKYYSGIPQTSLQQISVVDATQRGTRVIFKPDPKIFKTTLDFDYDRLASRFDELAYLNAGTCT